MNFKRIINSLSPAQIRLARAIEKSGLASFSQACKAIANKDPIVKEWLGQLESNKPSKKITCWACQSEFTPDQKGWVYCPFCGVWVMFVN